MTFIISLIALVIERFFDWSHLRQWHWYIAYEQMIVQRLSGKNAYLLLAIIIVPLLVAILLLQWLLQNTLYGVLDWVLQLFLFLYCLGPRNLWVDAFASINALKDNALKNAEANTTTPPTASQTIHDSLFIQANERIFAIVFWFALLGPIGAVLYRTLALSASSATTFEISTHARYLKSLLDWLPIRLFTLTLALGGHFSNVLACWGKKVFLGLEQNESLLLNCGAAALGLENQNVVLEESVEITLDKNTVHLLDRSFTILLVLVLLKVLLF